MKYFIGEVETGDVDNFGDDGLFEHEGTHYYYMVEFGTNNGGMEDFVITDSVGRNVPISVSHIQPLIDALYDITELADSVEMGKAVEELIESDAIRVVE